MKRLISFSLSAVMLVVSLFSFNISAFAADNFECGSNLIAYYDKDTSTLTVKGTGDMYNYTVSQRPEWKQQDKYVIENLVIDEGVTSVGDWAFDNITRIKTVSFPSTLTSIGTRAFSACVGIDKFTIPASVEKIGDCALKTATNGSPSRLKSIDVDENNNNYCSVDGVLYNKQKTVLIQVPPLASLTTLDLPDTVTTIEQFAGHQIQNVTEIKIPRGITTIKANAFKSAAKLKDVYIEADKSVVIDLKFLDDTNGVTIHGFNDSPVYRFAQENGISFKPLDYCILTFESNLISNTFKKEIFVDLNTSAQDIIAKAPALPKPNTVNNQEHMVYSWLPAVETATKNVTYTLNGTEQNHNFKDVVTKATATQNGSITPTCTLCGATKDAQTIYYPKTISLSATSYTYDGNVKKPTVTVKDANGKAISSSNYTVSVPTAKNPGKYTVKVTFKGNYEGTKNLTFTIKPRATTVKLTSQVNGFKVNWSKRAETTGYQIQYATRSNFSNAATVYGGATNTLSKTITGRAGGAKYYVRVRTYKNIGNGNYVYGNWSSAAAVTTGVAKANNKSTTGVSRGFKVTWAKISNVTGYQIQYATRSNFSNAATVYGGNQNATAKTITGRARNTTYYVRVRAYKNNGGKYVYGAWSNARSVRTK